MRANRLFSDEELKTMGKRTLDLLLEKLDSGDARALLWSLAENLFLKPDHPKIWGKHPAEYTYTNDHLHHARRALAFFNGKF